MAPGWRTRTLIVIDPNLSGWAAWKCDAWLPCTIAHRPSARISLMLYVSFLMSWRIDRKTPHRSRFMATVHSRSNAGALVLAPLPRPQRKQVSMECTRADLGDLVRSACGGFRILGAQERLLIWRWYWKGALIDPGFQSSQPDCNALIRPEEAADVEDRYRVESCTDPSADLQVQACRLLPDSDHWILRCPPMPLALFIRPSLPGRTFGLSTLQRRNSSRCDCRNLSCSRWNGRIRLTPSMP